MLCKTVFRYFWEKLTKPSFEVRFMTVLDKIPAVTDYQKSVIKNRYLGEMRRITTYFSRISIMYLLLSNIITIGSVLITSLLTLERVVGVPPIAGTIFFWTSWVSSLLVILANKLIYSFSIHKKFIYNKERLHNYEHEGWMFVSGSGKYLNMESFDDKFMLFNERISKYERHNIANLSHLYKHNAQNNGQNATESAIRINTPDIIQPNVINRPVPDIRPLENRHERRKTIGAIPLNIVVNNV